MKLNPFSRDADPATQGNTNMRQLHLCAIKDVRANEYQTPFFQPSQAHAVRVFKLEINRQDERNLLYLYPEDFELYYLGTFDQLNAQLNPECERIATGNQLKGERK